MTRSPTPFCLALLVAAGGCGTDLGMHTKMQSASDSNPTTEAARFEKDAQADGIALVAGATASRRLRRLAARPLYELKSNLEKAGFKNVKVISYENVLSASRDEMVGSLQHNLQSFMQEGDNYVVIAHSMGHFAAMAAILEGGLTARVGNFIGLAGAASGGTEPPRGCGRGPLGAGSELDIERCPVLEGLMIGTPAYQVDELKHRYALELAGLKKCSLAVTNDALLKPSNSGFFPDGENHFVSYARHDNLPSHKNTVGTLKSKCDL
jgi:hypothetical protein